MSEYVGAIAHFPPGETSNRASSEVSPNIGHTATPPIRFTKRCAQPFRPARHARVTTERATKRAVLLRWFRGAEGRKANGRGRGNFTQVTGRGERARYTGWHRKGPQLPFAWRGVSFCGEKRAGRAARVCVRLCNELPSQVGGTGPMRSRPVEGNGFGSCHRCRGRCGDVRAVLMSRSDRNQDWHGPSTWLPLVLLLRLVSMTVALSLCGGV